MDAEAYADMLPWLVFIAVDRPTGLDVTWAAASAGLCSLGLVAWSYWRGARPGVAHVGLVVFTACLLVALADPSWNTQVGIPRSVTVGLLSLAAFLSLPRTPLSEAYTAALVAPATHRDPRFRRVNVEITVAWGLGTALVATASGTTALVPDVFVSTFLGWVIPLVLAGGTVLWVSRRWDLFRVAIEGAANPGAPGRSPVVALSRRQQDAPDPPEPAAEIRAFRLRSGRDS